MAKGTDPPLPPRIDVHSHFLPPDYHDALMANGHEKVDGMPEIPPWSTEAHLEMMAINNVSKSILSISSPGTHIVPGKDQLGQDLTRHCNSYAARLKREYPDKFGFWAALPLPDVDAALKEIDIAVAEGADGFGMMTNYHGHYLGSPRLDPIFQRLNELEAIVFMHPTKPCIHHPNSSATTDALPFGSEYPVPIFEFFFDTARAVVNLFYSGTVEKYSKITFIIPHVGGSMPPLFSRFIRFGHVVPGVKPLNHSLVRSQIRDQFYFDLAGTIFDGSEGSLGQLKAFVEGYEISHKQLLYGSDFPFTRTPFVKEFADRMAFGLQGLFSEEEQAEIYEQNVKKLLSRKDMRKIGS
ncbi:amidohydrolase 2 [Aaosphaeria arxii CBS 175.79]|uniref:6-methylsalicylate decarboxylase n=1 Tax=Aaosphaeria arxii CBS 175.79 TaxID=1450172 RepID=A0A6A5Y853_9PLEO|nr:amidohydrolase 2 [Aaosphaeria arxii CBS 175.79]KAF2021207.1 amidohydrolase 2 [Aaosphaeria arxii CBS 175.79]